MGGAYFIGFYKGGPLRSSLGLHLNRPVTFSSRLTVGLPKA